MTAMEILHSLQQEGHPAVVAPVGEGDLPFTHTMDRKDDGQLDTGNSERPDFPGKLGNNPFVLTQIFQQ